MADAREAASAPLGHMLIPASAMARHELRPASEERKRKTGRCASMKLCLLPAIAVLSVTSGCAALPARVDPSGYAGMSCIELDNAIGENAKAITRLAIDRGTAARMSIPSWLFGASATITAVNDRRSARISDLQDQQAAMKAARRRAC